MVSYGNASGAVEAFNLGLLAQKGSLYVTRPTLFSYTAARDELLACPNDLFDVGERRCREDRDQPALPPHKATDAHRALVGRETTGSTLLGPHPRSVFLLMPAKEICLNLSFRISYGVLETPGSILKGRRSETL